MPVRVLFLHSGGDWIRGSECMLIALLRNLDRSEIRPFLCTSNKLLACESRSLGIETEFISLPEIMIESAETQLHVIRWAKACRQLISFVKQQRIQLLYCNGGSTCQQGYFVGKVTRRPVVSHIHSPYNRRYILLYRLHRANRVIAVSQAVQRHLTGKQRFHREIQVVYNGVDTDRFQPVGRRDLQWRTKLGLAPDTLVFGQVSSLIRRKGIDVLLRSFQVFTSSHSTSRLVIVGDGPESGEYKGLAQHLGIQDRVHFVGNQPDTLPYYQHVFDVNVLASRSDAFPVSLLEAAGCGLPSLAADVDGIGEAVADTRTGLLFRAEDHEMLAGRMHALAFNPELRARLGTAARQLTLERFSLDQYGRAIHKIILGEVAQPLG